MIFNIVSGGRRPVRCRLLGAPGETLTVTNGKKTFTVNNEGSLELKPGIYQITGSISGYTKTVEVDKAGDYTAYPTGTIYWYGREVYPLYLRTYGTDEYQIAEREANAIQLQAYFAGASGRERWSYVITNEPVDTSAYETIRFNVDVYRFQGDFQRYTVVGWNSEMNHSVTGERISNVAAGVYSVDSPGGEAYVGVNTYVNTKSSLGQHRAAARVYAIWME